MLGDLSRAGRGPAPRLVLGPVLVEARRALAVAARDSGPAVMPWRTTLASTVRTTIETTWSPSAAGSESSAIIPNTIEASPRGPNHPTKATL